MGTIDDNKIIDALKRCISNGAYCADCPIREECDPFGSAINQYSLDLIRKLRRENGQLKRKVTVTAKKTLNDLLDWLDGNTVRNPKQAVEQYMREKGYTKNKEN